MLVFPPDHLIYDAGVRLDNLHDFRADVLLNVIGNRDTVITVAVHLNRCVNRLEKTLFVDPRYNEASFVKSFRTFSASAYADSRK